MPRSCGDPGIPLKAGGNTLISSYNSAHAHTCGIQGAVVGADEPYKTMVVTIACLGPPSLAGGRLLMVSAKSVILEEIPEQGVVEADQPGKPRQVSCEVAECYAALHDLLANQ